jgi:hypothetical protein
MGKGSDPVTGYKYSFGIHMGLGRGPVNELVTIKVGDKVAWDGSMKESGDISINQPGLFGGDKHEGGIVGLFKLMMGEPTQKAPASLVAMLGHALPGFRRMVTAFYDGQISSNSAYPKAWKFRMRRSTKGWENDAPWYPEKAMILMHGQLVTTKNYVHHKNPIDAIGDWFADGEWEYTTSTSWPEIHTMNPAHMIFECLTNREWGRGLDQSALNVASFTEAADTLFDEGFGLCLRWTRRDNLESFVQSVIDHICATIYTDRQTALLTLKLIRKDYDPATLPIYDTNSGLLEIRENEVAALGPAINEVVIEYVDPVNNEKRTTNAQNLASLQASRGVFNSTKKSYPGIPTVELARRIAQRDLRSNAIALRRFTITLDRHAWRIPPGGVFRIKDTVRGINDMVVRVGRVEDGTLTKGVITITAVQDVFGLPASSFTGNQPPGGVKPLTQPILKRHRAFEVPYFLLKGAMKPADFAYVEDDAGFLGTVVEKPTDLSLGYNIYVKPSEPTPDDFPTT